MQSKKKLENQFTLAIYLVRLYRIKHS